MESSNLQPPIRRALSNAQLEIRVNQATASNEGFEAVMQLLVAQEALRAQDEAEIAKWISTLLSHGSPEALLAVENFKRAEQGLTPLEVASAPEVIELPEQASIDPEPEVPAAKPQANTAQNLFPWMNPAPPKTPVESEELPPSREQETVPEPLQQEAEPAKPAFTWFIQPDTEAPVTAAETVDEPEVIIPVEPEVQEVEVTVIELDQNTVVEVVEQESLLVPIGNETEDDFETLLAAAAAEEELTALEEKQSDSGKESFESNVLIPSDENRNRGFGSQLLVWLGLSATLVPILLVFAMVSLGLSAPTISIVLSAGYLVSGALIALATLAGQRSGQSTGIIARAIFGVWGNSIPNSVMFISRVVIAALIFGTFSFLMNGVEARIPDFNNVVASFFGIDFTVGLFVQLSLLVAVTVLALVGGNAARVIQVLLSLVAFGLVFESFFAFAGGGVSFATAGKEGLFSITAWGAAALVVLVNLTLWFAIAPNLAKAIPANVPGYKVFMSAFVSNFVAPVIIGIMAIAWLGQASLQAPESFTIQQAVLGMPKWAQGALVSGISLAMVFAAMLSIRSAALDIVSIFRFRAKTFAVTLTALLVGLVLVLFAQQPTGQQVEYLVNLFVLIAALSAGWIGIFAADTMERKLAYHELSLARSYGVYKKFNVLSLSIWLVTMIFAFAVIPVNLFGLGFMGFGLSAIGIEPSIGSAALGFFATALLGFLLTAPVRTAQIRKQEAEILELEARREQLKDIFVSAD